MGERKFWDTVERRSEGVDWLLGSVLRRYRDARGLSSEQVAVQLGCSREQLKELAACRLPDEAWGVAEYVDAVCSRYPVRPERLAELLREAWTRPGRG